MALLVHQLSLAKLKAKQLLTVGLFFKFRGFIFRCIGHTISWNLLYIPWKIKHCNSVVTKSTLTLWRCVACYTNIVSVLCVNITWNRTLLPYFLCLIYRATHIKIRSMFIKQSNWELIRLKLAPVLGKLTEKTYRNPLKSAILLDTLYALVQVT